MWIDGKSTQMAADLPERATTGSGSFLKTLFGKAELAFKFVKERHIDAALNPTAAVPYGHDA